MDLENSNKVIDTRDLMLVSIPAREDHEGYWITTVLISNRCPKCGASRGKPYEGISYDGSRRLHCHQWSNPCGHRDLYSDIRQEAKQNGLNKYNQYLRW